ETGETAIIVRRLGLAAVCLHEVPSHQPLRVTIAPSTALPLQSGAFGKALLAFAPPDILDEVLGLEPLPGPAAPDPDRLRTDLAEIVTTGVARSVGEGISGSVAIAAPIFRADGIGAATGAPGPDAR